QRITAPTHLRNSVWKVSELRRLWTAHHRSHAPAKFRLETLILQFSIIKPTACDLRVACILD
ncbi:MAG TPA: hypothetical protein PKZ32_04900, partial [Candidatus Melainabacteria bacterium]|nr:hypothetical protein [Candidatus Melainabacteria bacterium]